MEIQWIEAQVGQGLLQKLPISGTPLFFGTLANFADTFPLKQHCVPFRFLERELRRILRLNSMNESLVLCIKLIVDISMPCVLGQLSQEFLRPSLSKRMAWDQNYLAL